MKKKLEIFMKMQYWTIGKKLSRIQIYINIAEMTEIVLSSVATTATKSIAFNGTSLP